MDEEKESKIASNLGDYVDGKDVSGADWVDAAADVETVNLLRLGFGEVAAANEVFSRRLRRELVDGAGRRVAARRWGTPQWALVAASVLLLIASGVLVQMGLTGRKMGTEVAREKTVDSRQNTVDREKHAPAHSWRGTGKNGSRQQIVGSRGKTEKTVDGKQDTTDQEMTGVTGERPAEPERVAENEPAPLLDEEAPESAGVGTALSEAEAPVGREVAFAPGDGKTFEMEPFSGASEVRIERVTVHWRESRMNAVYERYSIEGGGE